ncbi:hypothetical protein KFK09_019373 [Dendrobium nobile]|uniref:DUF4283 domain-containing protein n=1 Tax=Dendrobium nobile TaxID=94219 RepID=A0A8T3AWJ1_DENNO|nr:hypothetical protein KFK09_019373 [Dendrobium nobile]
MEPTSYLDIGAAKSNSISDTIPNLSQSTFNGVPAVLLTDEEVLKLASPFQFTLMRILKWTPFFDIKEESPIVPIWISFPNLRLHFFNQKVLHALGSIFGRPLQKDQATASCTRPSMARILIEVDITKKHLKKIWVGSKAYGYMQKVEFEKVPEFCSHCKMHGHAPSDCFKLHPELKKTTSQADGKHGSIDQIYVSTRKVFQSDQVDLFPSSDKTEVDIVASQENLQIPNVDTLFEEENHETIGNNYEAADPKIFISVESMLKDIDNSDTVHSDLPPMVIVGKNSNSTPNDAANSDDEFLGEDRYDACEEGEFLPPSNGEQNVEQNVQNYEKSVSNIMAPSSIPNIASHSKNSDAMASSSIPNTINFQKHL